MLDFTTMIALQILVFLLSIGLVGITLLSAVRVLVLPRGAQDPVAFTTFITTRRLFMLLLRFAGSFDRRDAIMAYYAPISLLTLLPVWLTLVLLAYAGLFWATGIDAPYGAFVLSGSSLFTLGFASDNTLTHMVLSFTEATIGLILVALLIAYLPTIYTAFSARENAVRMLDVRAGTPPSVVELISRAYRIGKLESLGSFWSEWEKVFAQIEESHTSLPALVFLRSPLPTQSWVTAAGCVLDSAAFIRSSVDIHHDANADLCIRAGYLALRRIAAYFGIDYPADPHFPAEPISISHEEYAAVYDRLQEAGVPMKADREQAWHDFAGWRVNYDRVLLRLCAITMAPEAPWSSDRAPVLELPTLSRWRIKAR